MLEHQPRERQRVLAKFPDGSVRRVLYSRFKYALWPVTYWRGEGDVRLWVRGPYRPRECGGYGYGSC